MRQIVAVTAHPWYLSATPSATLRWLIRLRWATAFVEGLAVLAALGLPAADFPLRHIVWLLALAALANAAAAVRLSSGLPLARAATLLALLLDVALLTALIELTGGPFNPFSVVYVVYIALAAVTLGRVPGGMVGTAALAGYLVLIYWHTQEIEPEHHELGNFPTHLLAMWVTMSAAAELAAYFIAQASAALARREQDLEAMRVRAARSEHLASLTTLAAGAAHELSTPLATIALAARELERAVERASLGTTLAGDARLIRTEVDRCQLILDQMSGRAGGVAADDLGMLDVRSTIDDVITRLPQDRAARVQVDPHEPLPLVRASRAGCTQALTSLLTNAFDASADGEPVRVSARPSDRPDFVRIVVSDTGQGMSREVLARAGEPFFTTKEAGRGLGLGLFLARVFAERFGGSLTVQSERGTTAILELPRQTDEASAT